MGASDEILGGAPLAPAPGLPPVPSGSASGEILGLSTPDKLSVSMGLGLSHASDEAAKVYDLQRRTGVAPDAIAQDPTGIQRQYQDKSFDTQAFTEASPKTAAFVATDPYHAAVSKDSLAGMQGLEQQVDHHGWASNIGSTFMRGTAGLVKDVGLIPTLIDTMGQASVPRSIPPELQAAYSQSIRNNPLVTSAERFQAKMENPELLAQRAQGVARLWKTDKLGALRNFSYEVSEGLPAIIFLLASAGAGGPAVGTAALAEQGVSSASAGTDVANQAGLSPAAAASVGLAKGGIMVASDFLGHLSPLRAFEQTFEKTLGAGVGKDAFKTMLGDVIKSYAANVAKGGVIGAGTVVSNDLVDYASGLNPEAFDNILGQIIEGAGTMAVTNAIVAGPAMLQGIHARSQEIHQAEINRSFLTNVAEQYKANPLTKLSSTAAGDHIDAVLEGSHVQDAWSPAADFKTLYQKEGLDPLKAAIELGAGKEYADALANGTDFKIKTSEIIKKMADDPMQKKLIEHLKFDPSEATPAQAKEIEQQVLAEEKSATKAEPDSFSKAHDELLNQALAAGVPQRQAEASAAVWESRVRVRAERRGQPNMTPEELLAQWPLNVARAFNPRELAPAELTPEQLQLERAASNAAEKKRVLKEIGGTAPLINFLRNGAKMDMEKIKASGESADFVDMQKYGIFGGDKTPERALESAIDAGVIPENTSLVEFKDLIGEQVRALETAKTEKKASDIKRQQAIYDRKFAELNSGVDKKFTPVKVKVQEPLPQADELAVLREKLAKAEGALRTSDLTGLPNKKAFDEDAGKWKSIVAFDLDNFKAFNSLLGHEAVDKGVLPNIGATLAKVQGNEADFKIYHRSGDEFAIGVKEGVDPEAIAQQVKTALDSTVLQVNGIDEKTKQPVAVTIHGIGATHGTGSDYKAADAAAGAESNRRRTAGEKQDLRGSNALPRNVDVRALGDAGAAQGREGNAPQPDAGGMGSGSLDQATRGEFKYTPEESFIILMKKRNASTLPHEMWHRFFFELNQDAAHINGLDQTTVSPVQAKVQADLQAALKKVGAASFADLTDAQHEHFADMALQYLREGKAPSAELQPVFHQFRSWFVNIWRNVQALLQGREGLDDEMRGVFDRLLATDDAIAAAQAQQGAEPLEGLTTPKYLEAFQEARAAAWDRLSEKALVQWNRRQKSEWKAERDQHFKEALDLVNKKQDYATINALANGVDSEGKPLAAPVKLDPESIVAGFGKEALVGLPPEVLAKPGSKAQVSLDQAASNFGYESPEAMLKDITGKPSAEAVAAQQADATMDFLHGDILKDGTMPEEALQAVHNEKRALALRYELEHIAENNLPVLKGLIRETVKRVQPEAAVRSAAVFAISAKPVSDIKPNLYLNAENRMRRQAGEALAKGDFATAFDLKQKERQNHALYQAAVEARGATVKIGAYLKKFNNTEARKRMGKAGQDFIGAIDYIRNKYGVGDTESADRGHLMALIARQERTGNPLVMADSILNGDAPKNFKDSTFREVGEAYKSVKMIEHTAAEANKLLKANKEATLEDNQRALAASVKSIHGEGFGTDRGAEHDYDPGLLETLNNGRRKGVAWMLRPLAIIGEVDGHKPNGVLYNMLWEPKQAAETSEARRQRVFRQAEKGEIYGHYSREEKALLFLRKIKVPEINQSLTRERMLMLLANNGNAEGRQQIREGNGYTEDQLKAIFSHLEKRDLDTVRAMWNHIDSYWGDVKDQEFKLRGAAPEKVQSVPFEVTLADGSTHKLEGGYFPLLFDRDRSTLKPDLGDIKSVGDMFGGDFARWMTADGHTQDRVEHKATSVKLDLDGFTKHVSSVIHDLSYRETLIDLHKLVNDPGIKGEIQRAVGKEKWDELNPWIARMAGTRVYDPMDTMAGWVRSNLTSSILAWRISVGLKHAGSEFTTLHELGPRYAAKGLAAMANLPQIRENLDRMYSMSEYMKNRDDAGDRDLHDFIRGKGLLNKPGVMARMVEGVIGGQAGAKAGLLDSWKKELELSYFIAVRSIDKMVSFATWSGTYSKAMDGGFEGITAGDHKAAVSHANRMVQEVKGAGSPGDLPRILNGNDWMKLFTMFMTQRNVIFNQHAKSIQQGDTAAAQHAWRVASGAMLSALLLKWIVPAVWNKAVTKGLSKDDKELKHTALEAAAYPLEGVPFATEAARYALQKYGEGKNPSVTIPPLKFLEESFQAGHGLYAASLGDGMSKQELRSSAEVAGALFRLPGPIMFQFLDYSNDLLKGQQRPSNVGEALWRALVAGKE